MVFCTLIQFSISVNMQPPNIYSVFEVKVVVIIIFILYTVEPQLSEPNGRHTIRSDNRGVRIDERSRNSRSMGYRVGHN